MALGAYYGAQKEETELEEGDASYKKNTPTKKMTDVVDRKKTVKDLMKGRQYFGTGKMKEEVEQIDEISKTLAKNYRHKAGQQAMSALIDNKPTNFLGMTIPVSKKTAEKNSELIRKRSKGMSAAADRVSGAKPTSEAVETSQDKDAGKITTDMLTGRVPGGKLNSFKSFKTNLTTSGTQSIPTEIEKGEETKASEYHSTDPGPVDIKMDDKLSGTTTYTHSSKDKQVKNEEVKPELKKLRSKESKEQTHEISKFDNKVVQAKEEVEPINEDAWLNKYLLSKGINPNFVSQAVKISHAKSGAFMTWKQSHQNESVSVPFDKPYKSVSPVTTDKSGAKHTPISRAKDLARSALKKIKQDTGNEKG